MTRALAIVALAGMCTSACTSQPSGADSRIAYQHFWRGQSQILSVRSDGTGTVKLSQATGRNEYPDFSSDGNFLAYERSSAIYVVDADGTNRRMLVSDGYGPVWSPNGERLLFNRYRTGIDIAIVSIKADGTGLNELTSGKITDPPEWSPDGSRIAFVRERRDLTRLWVMNADGSEETRLTGAPDTQDYGPEWSPDGRKLLFTRSRSYRNRCFEATSL